jgi:Rps23 Pro-64 3,4-dihydroxylase Tpa1-like proline 4-hydroxylase
MEMARDVVASVIADRIAHLEAQLRENWLTSAPVRHFVVDELLEPSWVHSLAGEFPEVEDMILRSSIRERKRVGIAVDQYARSVKDALYAFQDPRVVDVVARITGYRVQPDPTLYASGISVMAAGDFLNPHIDNSHDGDRKRYRALNLLFYVSPDWSLAKGGNLELWDRGIRHPHVIESRFNRLVVMETNQASWHSVNQVRVSEPRKCVSNYYFSTEPPGGRPYFNVTTFAGRPEEPFKRIALGVMDGVLLNTLGRTFPFLTKRTKHRIRPSR